MSEGFSQSGSVGSLTTVEYAVGIELDRWCAAVKGYPGEVDAKLLFKVIKELVPLLRTAVCGDAVLNLVALGQRLAEAGKFVVTEREVIVALAGALPSATSVDAANHTALAQTLGIVESVLPGTLDDVKAHWELERMRCIAR
jgi:hypothetical protein